MVGEGLAPPDFPAVSVRRAVGEGLAPPDFITVRFFRQASDMMAVGLKSYFLRYIHTRHACQSARIYTRNPPVRAIIFLKYSKNFTKVHTNAKKCVTI